MDEDLLRIVSFASDAGWHIYLYGEADMAGVVELSAVLDAITVHPGQQVHIGVAELRFIDLSCLRALIRFARRAQKVGVPVVIHRPSSAFTMIHRAVEGDALQLVEFRTRADPPAGIGGKN